MIHQVCLAALFAFVHASLMASSASAANVATCKVSGRVTSAEYTRMKGTLQRAIVSVVAMPGKKQVGSLRSEENVFAFDLPPGDYQLQCTGNGSLGATFEPTYVPFTVDEGAKSLDLGTIDMPASATTKLFGQAAPELQGVIEWKNTDAVSITELKGKVVILDFWAYTCSICIHHMPDLTKLAEKYPADLVALTIHDGSLKSMEEIESTLSETALKKLGKLPIALDRFGPNSVFKAYGMRAVPAMILIDTEGRVVRRFHHAGDPELEKAVSALIEEGERGASAP